MFTARKKILKEKNAEPDVFEESVAQVGLARICCIRSALYKVWVVVLRRRGLSCPAGGRGRLRAALVLAGGLACGCARGAAQTCQMWKDDDHWRLPRRAAVGTAYLDNAAQRPNTVAGLLRQSWRVLLAEGAGSSEQ